MSAPVSERGGSVMPGGALNVRDLVSELEAKLLRVSVSEARSEARDMIAALLDESRFWPSLNADVSISAAFRERALAAAEKRCRGAPFAYCVGKAAFRYLTLDVDESVLIPRQETEQLVELVLREVGGQSGGVAADIGTGSGAIALSLALEGSFDRVVATDVSVAALALARRNAAAAVVRGPGDCVLEFLAGDMCRPIRETGLRAVVSNPPYVAFEEAGSLPASVRNWEPPEALYSGDHGMRAVRGLVRGSARVLQPGGLLAFEVDARRSSDAAELVMSSGDFTNVRIELDLAGRERFVLAIRENR